MAHTQEQLDSIITSAMAIHRDRGNAELSDEAKSEIRKWWKDNSDKIDRKMAAGCTHDDFSMQLANAISDAQRSQTPSPARTIGGGEPMRTAMATFVNDITNIG
jgi:hypothetical protein